MRGAGIVFRVTTDDAAFRGRVVFDGRDRLEFATAAMRGMDPFVPFDTGRLAGSATADEGVVHYPVDYASFPYSGHGRIHQDHHMRASAHWDRAYSATAMTDLREAVISAIRRKG